jgi:hypothetical protein
MSTDRYASNTSVSADRSRAEIERTLTRYGARGFMYGWDQEQAVLGFVARGRNVRFFLPMPMRQDPEFTRTPTGKPRSQTTAEAAYDQAVRQRWRALALVIKAKLEAVAAGIVTFDEEFLAHLVLPTGETVAQAIGPGIEEAYRTGRTPQLLPSPVARLEIEPPR